VTAINLYCKDKIQDTSSLLTLIKLKNLVKTSTEQASIYRLNCFIIDISPKSLDNAIKKYCHLCNKLFILNITKIIRYDYNDSLNECCGMKVD